MSGLHRMDYIPPQIGHQFRYLLDLLRDRSGKGRHLLHIYFRRKFDGIRTQLMHEVRWNTIYKVENLPQLASNSENIYLFFTMWRDCHRTLITIVPADSVSRLFASKAAAGLSRHESRTGSDIDSFSGQLYPNEWRPRRCPSFGVLAKLRLRG